MPNFKILPFSFSLLFVIVFTFMCNAQNDTTILNHKNDTLEITNIISKVYHFEIHQEIGPGASRITERAIKAAEDMNADFILLDLDTYGGLVSDADMIRTALLNTEITTIAYVRNNAASAGALISIACDSIYMKTGSTIGAASVVNQEGQVMPEKYQSYMRNKMRATAEATNRNPDIAEGMVDQKVVIEGITDSTSIITFSVDEAIKNGFCNGKAHSIEEVIAQIGLEDYEITKHKISKVEKIIQLLINPAFSGILLLVIIGGLYFELQTPGVGFPIMASFIAALLYFAPLYLEGLAANWEIALFIVGILLLGVEVFVLPGSGVAGVLGIAAIITSLSLAMVRNIDGFDFTYVPSGELTQAFLIVSVVIIGGTLLFILGSNEITKKRMFGKLTLRTELTKETGSVIMSSITDQAFLGVKAVAATDLRPAGKVIIDGDYHDAQSDGGYIEKGEEVIVKKVSGAYLVVNKIY